MKLNIAPAIKIGHYMVSSIFCLLLESWKLDWNLYVNQIFNRTWQINRINKINRINNRLIYLCKLGPGLIRINKAILAFKENQRSH